MSPPRKCIHKNNNILGKINKNPFQARRYNLKNYLRRFTKEVQHVGGPTLGVGRFWEGIKTAHVRQCLHESQPLAQQHK